MSHVEDWRKIRRNTTSSNAATSNDKVLADHLKVSSKLAAETRNQEIKSVL
jgi:hypothetical protein